jgi:hypothetical protein
MKPTSYSASDAVLQRELVALLLQHLVENAADDVVV